MAHRFEQFVRFTTDAAGLERTFRLLQSIVQILSSYTLPFECLLFLLDFLSSSTGTGKSASPNPATTHAILIALRVRLALARRYFRLFRFLESFNAAQKLYVSLSLSPPTTDNQKQGQEKERGSPPPRRTQADVWLDVFGRTFNGMYLLLEAATVLDAQKIPGLALWGPELERTLTIEGQRFWLFSLVCGVFSGLVKIFKVLAYTPIPVPTSTSTSSAGHVGSANGSGGEKEKEDPDEKADEDGGAKEYDEENWDLKKEQARLRRVVENHKLGRMAWRREVRSRISALGRRVVSDALDITLPGSVVGWVNVDTGTVGLAMFVTTVLTSIEIWERCGREVAGNNKK
ncbi:hypothetical protein HD806DRAFT_494759 [Xylariaceae sp. AK1471]|nr:hypothetical protein HD806DRAFT_494759 [Xylariaceae sp. AK1471]